MTRKRLIKLLMSVGYSRNAAQNVAKSFRCLGIPYLYGWYGSKQDEYLFSGYGVMNDETD